MGQLINEPVGEIFHLGNQVPEGLHPQSNALGGVQDEEQVHRAVWEEVERQELAGGPAAMPPHARLPTLPTRFPSQQPPRIWAQGNAFTP